MVKRRTFWWSRTPRDPSRLTAVVKPLHTYAVPVPVTLCSAGDKLAISVTLEILALELLHDRETIVTRAADRAAELIREQLAVTQVNVKRLRR